MTLARISIEVGAWTDPRFAMLARILGLADSDHALIRCARVWAWQTERYTEAAPTHVVTAELLDTLIAPGAAAAMVRAGLAEEVPEGFRIRGSEGRIEWLANRRRAAVIGGRARQMGTQVGSKRGRRDNRDQDTRTSETGHVGTQVATHMDSHMACERERADKEDPPGYPCPSHVPSQKPALLSGSGSPDRERARVSEGSGPVHVGPEPPDLGPTRDRVQWPGARANGATPATAPARAETPSQGTPAPLQASRDPRAEEQARLVGVVWQLHQDRHAAVRRDIGADRVGARGYVPAMGPHDPAGRALGDLVRAQPTVDGLEEKLRHTLAVAEHEARHADPPSLRWFGATLWSVASYGRALTMAVGEDRRPARPAEREGLTAKSLRRVAELEALEAEEERRAVDGGVL